MSVAADQVIVEQRVERQLVDQILHAGVEAVVARLVPVQPDDYRSPSAGTRRLTAPRAANHGKKSKIMFSAVKTFENKLAWSIFIQ